MLTLSLWSTQGRAYDLGTTLMTLSSGVVASEADNAITQSGKSLQQAIEQVRRQYDVKRIISAETKDRGGRKVHVIRFQTKDGKVRTVTVNA